MIYLTLSNCIRGVSLTVCCHCPVNSLLRTSVRMPSNSEGSFVLDPTLRLKQLSNVGGAVTVDHSVPAERYLRSGPQMEKMVCTLL